jgi:leucyl-tRNA synthetase
MMIFLNDASKLETVPRTLWEPFVLLLAPYAPHLAEEMWEKLGHKESSSRAAWPLYDESLTLDEQKEVVIQVNGKIRERITVAAGTAEESLKVAALALPKIVEWMGGKQPVKVIVVKDKLVNIVAKG